MALTITCDGCAKTIQELPPHAAFGDPYTLFVSRGRPSKPMDAVMFVFCDARCFSRYDQEHPWSLRIPETCSGCDHLVHSVPCAVLTANDSLPGHYGGSVVRCGCLVGSLAAVEAS